MGGKDSSGCSWAAEAFGRWNFRLMKKDVRKSIDDVTRVFLVPPGGWKMSERQGCSIFFENLSSNIKFEC